MFLIRIMSVWLPWLLDPILGCSLSAKSFTLANVVNLSSNPLFWGQMAKNIIEINVNIRQIVNSFKQISFIFRPKWCKWLNSREILDGTMENLHGYHWYKGCPTVPHVDPSPPHRQNRRDLFKVVNWLSGSISIMIDYKATNQEIHRNLWEPMEIYGWRWIQHTRFWICSATKDDELQVSWAMMNKKTPVRQKCGKPLRFSEVHGFTGWWFQPLWKILVRWDDYSQYMESHKIHVPNRQPVSPTVSPFAGRPPRRAAR